MSKQQLFQEDLLTVPHLFINRPRFHHPTKDRTDSKAHFRWETANAVLYLIGGALFIIGSVFFFPVYENLADLGVYVFLIGSLIYLVVTGHDMIEVFINRRFSFSRSPSFQERLEMIAAVTYLAGTLFFTMGCIFFLSSIGRAIAGSWCFIIGSLLFVVGACINVLQIVKARSLQTLQLMNLTAITFVVGSVLFAFASMPYLWDLKNQSDRFTLFTYIAWEYVIGSVLFFLGGLFNYWRAWRLWREVSATR